MKIPRSDKMAGIYSIVLHLGLLLVMLSYGVSGTGTGHGGGHSDKEQQTEGQGQHDHNGQNGNILPPPSIEVMAVTPELQEAIRAQDKAMKLAEEKPKKTLPKKKPQTTPVDECTTFYGGIGVGISAGLIPYQGQIGRMITFVYAGYPGAEVGLQPGDLILDEVVGPVGELVTFRVYRQGQITTYQAVRAKICTATP